MITYSNIVRYLIIPPIGFIIGGIVFLFIKKTYPKYMERIECIVKKHRNKLFVIILVIYSTYYMLLACLRYYTCHITFFDFGIYDWLTWKIYNISWFDFLHKLHYSITGHFQPILVVYSLLYNLSIEPVALNILQAIFVISGIIPLYLIAKKQLKNYSLTLFICFLYLFYPATQFNIAGDFHPDHLIIPLLFWCYYFIEKDKYILLSIVFLLGCTIKESFIIAIAFMGIYIICAKKKYFYGLSVFILFFILFIFISFFILPSLATIKIYSIEGTSAFGYLFNPDGITPILHEIFMFPKWRFPLFLLVPLLFIPILSPLELIPALPLFAIQMLSTVTNHQVVSSQYTAGFIPPIFVASVYAIDSLRKKLSKKSVIAIFAWILVMFVTFNIAHSPTPLSVGFWDKNWSDGRWDYTNYLTPAFPPLCKAITLIPSNPNVKVVTHCQIYDKRLAHRYFYACFDENYRQADYILLDNKQSEYIDGILNKKLYQEVLKNLEKNKSFKLIYNNDGILLFHKVINE